MMLSFSTSQPGAGAPGLVGTSRGQRPSARTFTAALWLLFLLAASPALLAQAFVHPGGLHTLADLERMKTNVLAGNHPWIDDWRVLVTDSQAQSNYTAHATADFNVSRQNADADAHAAYLNTIRWYVSGDANFANTATNLLNQWSATVTTNTETGGGLSGLPTMSFAVAGELLRAYGGWQPADFTAFTNLMIKYLYPPCSNYLSSQPCNYAHWTSWDAPNNAAILAIGVLCDDTNKYQQAVNFFQRGAGSGAISNAVPYLYGPLGQCEESGRDQEHCTLGIADLGLLCQVAWNQGLDLYGFAGNRLLAGIEYLARYNLSQDVPYTPFNNCAGENLFFVSANGRGRLDDRPVYELFYNHYVVRQGLSAPNLRAMAQLYRPEHGSADHFGYGTLTFTLNAAASPYPPLPAPLAPVGLTARAGIAQIALDWTPSAGDWARGYHVLRSTSSGGPYVAIASWTASTFPRYLDTSVIAGTTYFYVVSATNQTGASVNSSEVSATPAAAGSLPGGWTQQDIGSVTSAGSVQSSGVGNNTLALTGAGTGIGGTGDGGFSYACRLATNNFTLIARLTGFSADQMGLMMRGSLATNAATVQFFLANNARQSVFAVRSSNGGNLNHYNSGDQFTYPPAWYRLVRSGNTFTASQSADGLNWVTVQAATVGAIPASGYYVGLAINSGSAIFDNVVYTNAAVTGTFAPPVAPAGLTATAVASNLVYLTWSPVTNAVAYNLRRSTVSGSGYVLMASNLAASACFDPTPAAATTYYYVASAINGGGESTNSSSTAVTTPSNSIPAPPVGLQATATTTQIGLTWGAALGATSYNVKRSTAFCGPFTNLATDVVAIFADTNVVRGTNYFYVVSAVNRSGESSNSAPVAGVLLNRLAGTIIGTAGSFGNLGNTRTNAFDANLNSFFDSPNASGDWCGLDFGLGVSNVIGAIQYCPRATFASRMVGGLFQGANDSGFTNPTTLFTVAGAPAYSNLTLQAVGVTNAFRYVRYLGPGNGFCNVAEIEFDGNAFVLLPAAPANLQAVGGNGVVSLNWSGVANAFGYHLKRSTASSGVYAIIADGLAGTNDVDTDVTNGIAYYYVVSAINAAGESTNTLPVSARPVSPVPPPLALAVSGGQWQLTWPSDHTGWRLQMQTNPLSDGLGLNWLTVPNSTNVNQFAAPVDPATGCVFYRLIYP